MNSSLGPEIAISMVFFTGDIMSENEIRLLKEEEEASRVREREELEKIKRNEECLRKLLNYEKCKTNSVQVQNKDLLIENQKSRDINTRRSSKS